MRILKFTFKDEAKWILILNLALIAPGLIGLLIVRVFMAFDNVLHQ